MEKTENFKRKVKSIKHEMDILELESIIFDSKNSLDGLTTDWRQRKIDKSSYKLPHQQYYVRERQVSQI